MDFSSRQRQELVQRLRLALPLPAHPRPPLISSLRRIAPDAARARLTVTGVYDVCDETELMCLLDLKGYSSKSPWLVVPLKHLALGRGNAVFREIDLYHKRGGIGTLAAAS